MAAQRSIWRNVTIVAAVVTMAGGIVVTGISQMGTSQQSEGEQQIELCKLAYAALGDETVSSVMTEAQAKQFVADQLLLAKKCASRLP
jgi:hypothetical protein